MLVTHGKPDKLIRTPNAREITVGGTRRLNPNNGLNPEIFFR